MYLHGQAEPLNQLLNMRKKSSLGFDYEAGVKPVKVRIIESALVIYHPE